MPESRIVEIRTYKLKPGGQAEFHRLVCEKGVPLLHEWKTDVVAYGPSASEPDAYFLVRAYDSVQELNESQDSFYASDAWRKGPREAIMALIESTTGASFSLSPEAVDALRQVR